MPSSVVGIDLGTTCSDELAARSSSEMSKVTVLLEVGGMLVELGWSSNGKTVVHGVGASVVLLSCWVGAVVTHHDGNTVWMPTPMPCHRLEGEGFVGGVAPGFMDEPLTGVVKPGQGIRLTIHAGRANTVAGQPHDGSVHGQEGGVAAEGLRVWVNGPSVLVAYLGATGNQMMGCATSKKTSELQKT